MYKEPPDKREKTLNRITRNRKIYFAVFYHLNQMKVKKIYEIEPEVLLKEAEKKLDQSSSSHIGFPESWVRKNGRLVYNDKGVS
jgi:hypothetical protein